MGPGAQRSALSKTGEREAVNLANFFAELKRRNVYRVAVAYAVVGWLLMQVATQVFPFFEIPNWAVRLVVLLLIIGFPVALILAWAFELRPEGLKRIETVDAEHQPTSKWILCSIHYKENRGSKHLLRKYSRRSKHRCHEAAEVLRRAEFVHVYS